MVTIVNNNDKKVVTMGAYENFYKPLGYEIVKNQPLKEPVEVVATPVKNDKKDESEKKTSKIQENKKRM